MVVKNDLLGFEDLHIYQNTEGFSFSIDSLLLANYLNFKKNAKVLEIGTGTGVIPLLLSTKSDTKITSLEIQEEVYELALRNIKENRLEETYNLINIDAKKYVKNTDANTFDVIFTNPPFYKVNENNKVNDKQAKTISRHEKELTIEDICKIAKKLLKDKGRLVIIHRTSRMSEIFSVMKKHNLEPKFLQFAYKRIDSESEIFICEARKNSGADLKVKKPIILHEGNEYTDQIKRMMVKLDEE